jgi:hypothetical protein
VRAELKDNAIPSITSSPSFWRIKGEGGENIVEEV